MNQLVELLNTQLALTALTAGAARTSCGPRSSSEGIVSAGPPAYLGADPNDPVTFLHPTPDGYVVYRDAVLAAIG